MRYGEREEIIVGNLGEELCGQNPFKLNDLAKFEMYINETFRKLLCSPKTLETCTALICDMVMLNQQGFKDWKCGGLV